jgi:thiamine biosynthesis protein ThiS
VIRVNDLHDVPWQEGMTVARLLEACRYTSPKIAVFVDGEHVERASYDAYAVDDGAKVQVLHLIGGG